VLTRAGVLLLVCSLCPVAAAETPAPTYRIGLVHVGAPGTCILAPGFEQAFARRGLVAGKTVVFERFGAAGQLDRLPAMLDQLVSQHVDLIVTCGYPAAVAAAQRASNIPLVVEHAGDPVETKMVESLAHPGGNITGVSQISTELSAKRLELLKEAVPGIHTVALLWNERDLAMQMRSNAAQVEAKRLGLVTELLPVRAPNDFAEAFAEMDRHPPDAILLVADALTVTNHQAVFDYAVAHRIPDMEEVNYLADGGGLLAYGPDEVEEFNRAADLAIRILHGAKPGDLPLELPTRFRFSVNLKTAHELGLTIPETILVRADDVIE